MATARLLSIQVGLPASGDHKAVLSYAISRPGLTERVEGAGRTGWDHRVLREGKVEAGQRVTLLEPPCPEWSIGRVAATARNRTEDPASAAELHALPALSAAWRHGLASA